jgi:hypothetical protein
LLDQHLLLERVDQLQRRHDVLRFDDAPAAAATARPSARRLPQDVIDPLSELL